MTNTTTSPELYPQKTPEQRVEQQRAPEMLKPLDILQARTTYSQEVAENAPTHQSEAKGIMEQGADLLKKVWDSPLGKAAILGVGAVLAYKVIEKAMSGIADMGKKAMELFGLSGKPKEGDQKGLVMTALTTLLKGAGIMTGTGAVASLIFAAFNWNDISKYLDFTKPNMLVDGLQKYIKEKHGDTLKKYVPAPFVKILLGEEKGEKKTEKGSEKPANPAFTPEQKKEIVKFPHLTEAYEKNSLFSGEGLANMASAALRDGTTIAFDGGMMIIGEAIMLPVTVAQDNLQEAWQHLKKFELASAGGEALIGLGQGLLVVGVYAGTGKGIGKWLRMRFSARERGIVSWMVLESGKFVLKPVTALAKYGLSGAKAAGGLALEKGAQVAIEKAPMMKKFAETIAKTAPSKAAEFFAKNAAINGTKALAKRMTTAGAGVLGGPVGWAITAGSIGMLAYDGYKMYGEWEKNKVFETRQNAEVDRLEFDQNAEKALAGVDLSTITTLEQLQALPAFKSLPVAEFRMYRKGLPGYEKWQFKNGEFASIDVINLNQTKTPITITSIPNTKNAANEAKIETASKAAA